MNRKLEHNKSIPPDTAPFFQEYHFGDLDPETHQGLIIERILSYGNRQEIRWVFEQYGKQTVAVWLQEEGCFKLPRRCYNFFCVVLRLEPVIHPCVRKRIWPY